MTSNISNSIFPKNIPIGTVLGVNYSGMHDTAIALVAPDGTPIFAVSLERISRKKQDGRHFSSLLNELPWDRISKAAISVESHYKLPFNQLSKLHPLPFEAAHEGDLSHVENFTNFFEDIPVEKIYIPHHLSHAASAFWGSGFSEALCFVYDGGMSNENWFGGLYSASKKNGINPLDQFAALLYSNVAHLYSAVTALLGFHPLRHEGKITGLAAYGKPTPRCLDLLGYWFKFPENFGYLTEWKNMYSDSVAPSLSVNQRVLQDLRKTIAHIPKEEFASTVQYIAEEHIIEIIRKSRKEGLLQDNICLSGGLFANVKINQRIFEEGFSNIFISPPMTDDGTALGAAWQVLSMECSNFSPKQIKHMYLGPSYSHEFCESLIKQNKILYESHANVEKYIAERISHGDVVAIFQGAAEFGPRSLGNRSILASATKSNINDSLNSRLDRTEFMPFAPVIREEDASEYFYIADGQISACKYMTITVNCTNRAKQDCPAIVHIDGTARPQLVGVEDNVLIHNILGHYKQFTGKLALVNTSFNIHEEPIVCSPEDALRGFFEAGLDILYIEGVGIIKRNANTVTENNYLKQKLLRIRKETVEKNELLKEAEIRKDVKAQQAEAKAQQAEAKAQQAEAKAQQASNQAQQAQSQAQAHAAQLEAIYTSRTWRLTAPLRQLMNFLRSFKQT